MLGTSSWWRKWRGSTAQPLVAWTRLLLQNKRKRETRRNVHGTWRSQRRPAFYAVTSQTQLNVGWEPSTGLPTSSGYILKFLTCGGEKSVVLPRRKPFTEEIRVTSGFLFYNPAHTRNCIAQITGFEEFFENVSVFITISCSNFWQTGLKQITNPLSFGCFCSSFKPVCRMLSAGIVSDNQYNFKQALQDS